MYKNRNQYRLLFWGEMIMIKKKNLYFIIFFGLAAFFCFGAFLSFNAEKSAICADFLNGYHLNDNVRINASDMTTDEYMQYSLGKYPTLISIYDLKGNLAAQSGSFINLVSKEQGFNDKYIYIDPYLDSDSRQRLADIKKQKEYYKIYELDYFVDEEEIVPVTIKMRNTNHFDDETEIHFSTAKNVSPDNTVKVFKGYINYKFIDMDENSIEHGIYDDMRVKHNHFAVDYKENVSSYSNDGSGYSGPEYCEYNGIVDFSNGKYCVFITMQIRPVLYTLTSETFWNQIKLQVLYILILGIVLIFFVNKFYSKSKKMEESKRVFTNAAAHELKTPLAVIQNQCECVIENIAPQKNIEYVNSIYEESRRMSRLVSTLLQYNRLVSLDSIKKEKCSLSQIITVETEKYKSFAKAYHIELSAQICDGASVVCNRELIALAADNFLSNAVKYSSDNSTITVTLKKIKNRYRFSVCNEGRGIEPEYRESLWDILYRDDKARNSSDNSSGMGLAICRQIFELHHYKYGFNNRSNGVEFFFITD